MKGRGSSLEIITMEETAWLESPLGMVAVIAEKGIPKRITLGGPVISPGQRKTPGGEKVPEGGLLREVWDALRDYFLGKDPDPGLVSLLICLSRPTTFRKKVLQETALIPRGEVITYGELAGRIGKPQGPRAVAGALAWNPFPVLIPCHRVVGKGGGLGGFSQGIEWKAALLSFEGIPLWGSTILGGQRERAARISWLREQGKVQRITGRR
jgi:methylated-DNA-[protein]-cysteine S-methyltransferase